MRMPMKPSVFSLVICGAILWPTHLLAQTQAGNAADANTGMPSAQRMPRADDIVTAQFGPPPPAAPIVNPPDPLNAGTLAESVRTTALAQYPGRP